VDLYSTLSWSHL